ncbi:hypothetical protein BD309DRAFT_106641 [Dichomitus squalens]|nr:hypothetical protein BD309DRAFT_106641 [Dichomitus squalens]
MALDAIPPHCSTCVSMLQRATASREHGRIPSLGFLPSCTGTPFLPMMMWSERHWWILEFSTSSYSGLALTPPSPMLHAGGREWGHKKNRDFCHVRRQWSVILVILKPKFCATKHCGQDRYLRPEDTYYGVCLRFLLSPLLVRRSSDGLPRAFSALPHSICIN